MYECQECSIYQPLYWALDKVRRLLNQNFKISCHILNRFDTMAEIWKYSGCTSWKQKCYKEKKTNHQKAINKQTKSQCPKTPKAVDTGEAQQTEAARNQSSSVLSVHTNTVFWRSPSVGICQKSAHESLFFHLVLSLKYNRLR